MNPHIHTGSFSLHIPHLSRVRFLHTTGWAVLLSALVVALAATLARATLSLSAAVSDKPDLAIYVLLKDEEVEQSTLIREREVNGEPERSYLVVTKTGPKLVQLRKQHDWYIENEESLHE